MELAIEESIEGMGDMGCSMSVSIGRHVIKGLREIREDNKNGEYHELIDKQIERICSKFNI